MRSAIRKRLQRAGMIVVIIAGGMVVGALTPAYSQDHAADSAGIASTR